MDAYIASMMYEKNKKTKALGADATAIVTPTKQSHHMGLAVAVAMFGYAFYLSWTSNKLIDTALQRFTLQNSAEFGSIVNFFKALSAGGASASYLVYYYFFKLHIVKDLKLRLQQP